MIPLSGVSFPFPAPGLRTPALREANAVFAHNTALESMQVLVLEKRGQANPALEQENGTKNPQIRG
jgi:hypothetical protein